MTYRVENANRRVEKQILRLPRQVRNRVARAILELEDNPRPHRCKKLVGDIYRVRVGGYRIIYKNIRFGEVGVDGQGDTEERGYLQRYRRVVLISPEAV